MCPCVCVCACREPMARRVGSMRQGTLLGELSRLRCVVFRGRAAGGLGLEISSAAPAGLPPAARDARAITESSEGRRGARRALSSSSPSLLRAPGYCDVRSRAFARGRGRGKASALQNKGFQESEKNKGAGGRRRRLDEVCREFYPQHSRNLLQSWIMQGKVKVDGRVVTKSGHLVPRGSKVLVEASEPKYVCRAGLKMEAALARFEVAVAGRVALDAGLSTGGFTDCLLQNGAARVYGVDVGYGQVAEKIRVDPRVVVMERTNVRHLVADDLPEKVQIATLDLSFISILKVRSSERQHRAAECRVSV